MFVFVCYCNCNWFVFNGQMITKEEEARKKECMRKVHTVDNICATNLLYFCFNLQSSIFNLQSSIFNLQSSTASVNKKEQVNEVAQTTTMIATQAKQKQTANNKQQITNSKEENEDRHQLFHLQCHTQHSQLHFDFVIDN